MRGYLTYKHAFWFALGAALVFVLSSVLGIVPTYTNYCTYHEGGYKNCTSHYLVFIPAVWIIDHLEASAAAVTAVATGFIAHFTKTLWEISRSQLDHGRQVERAYVKMSHKAPGVLFGSDRRVDISVDVKNFGRTPARITDVLLSTMIIGRNQPLPTDPIYTPPVNRILPSAFLVCDDSFNVSASLVILEQMQFSNIMIGELHLYVVGYVDYVDQFEQRHRGGYGRRYVHNADGNNLIFVDARRYNYDRVRLPGEGKD
jgi:hypothetical protein